VDQIGEFFDWFGLDLSALAMSCEQNPCDRDDQQHAWVTYQWNAFEPPLRKRDIVTTSGQWAKSVTSPHNAANLLKWLLVQSTEGLNCGEILVAQQVSAGVILRAVDVFVARRTGRQSCSPADEAGAPMTIGRKAPAEMDRAKAQRGMIDKTTPLYVVCSP
jgi:hypothetical protein